MVRRRTFSLLNPVLAGLLLAVLLVAPSQDLAAAAGDMLLEAPFPGLAPEGITLDLSDGSFWVTSFLDGVIRHFDAELQPLGSIPSPFLPSESATGIAYRPANDTLLVVEPITHELLEIDKTGNPTGFGLFLPILPVVNPLGSPVLRGMAFHPQGGGGIGSVYVVETVGSLIYEIDLLGEVVRTFEHPDDPDGYPGSGAGAPAGGIELILDAGGGLLGIDLVGAEGGFPVVRRLDGGGGPTGLSIPLAATGAADVGGIARALYVDPQDGSLFDALYGTSEASAELFVVDGELPPLADLLELGCESAGDTITLTWTAGQTYDQIIVERGGDPYLVLAGDAVGFTDSALADGVYRYSVRGESGTLATLRLTCVGVVGAGQVLDFVELPGIQWAIDITEDSSGLLWITSVDNEIHLYDKDLAFLNLFTGPFNEPDDELTGIAYRPDSDTLLLYNATTNLLQEVSLAAAPIGGPVVAEIPVPDDDPPWVGGIAYDPQGNGGDGEIYAVELSRGIVYRLARDGALLGSFIHPEEVANPTPDPSYIDNYSLGISGVPEVGNGFEELDLSGGSVFERKSTWVRRVDASTGAPSGFQMPTAGIETVNSVRYLALANSDYLGEPVAFVLSVRANDNVLLRVRREPPPVPSISFLRCAQTGNEDRAEISFLNHGPYDAINVERDGSLITTLPGDATSHVDLEATPGRHRYRLTPELGGVTAEPRECELRLGIGALLRRNFVFPAVSPYQMTRDPTDGSFLIAVNTPALSESFFRYDADLTFVATIPSPVQPPWQVAAFAVRPTPSGSEIWSISWEVPAPWLQPQLFELTVQDATGTIIEGPTVLEIPGQPVGVALTYPAAMAHDTDSDTFWFLERNTDLFWRMDTGGNLIASIPHPEPPLQDFVFNLGLAFDPARRSFTATTAGALDQQITRAIGFTPEGILTGEKIFLEEAGIDPLYGIARADGRLWVSGSFGGVGILAELKAADPIAPPAALACVEGAPNSVTLTWDEPVPYDEVVVRRDGVEIAVLPGGTGEHTDAAAANGAHAYTAAGRVGAGESAPSACSLSVTGLDPVFIRGEVTGDGEINLADPILVLGYLFAAGQEPACLDAADADDNGAVNIGDPIWLLTFLFASGLPPLPPFPAPGTDPTPDGLGCG